MLRLLLSMADGRTTALEVEPRDMTIGRAAHADLWVDDPLVSAEHERLRHLGGQVVLTDLGSRNGTWTEGTRVREATLRSGDRFTIGNVTMLVSGPEIRTPSSLVRTGLAEVHERALGVGRPDDRRLALLFRLGEELNRRRARSRRSRARSDELLGVAAHDLRGPLASAARKRKRDPVG